MSVPPYQPFSDPWDPAWGFTSEATVPDPGSESMFSFSDWTTGGDWEQGEGELCAFGISGLEQPTGLLSELDARFPECGYISGSALQLNNDSQEIMPLGSEPTTLYTEPGNQASTSNNNEEQINRPEAHILSHGRVQSDSLTCDECQEILQSRNALNVHAEERQHLICKCECGTSFSRLDGLERHLEAAAQDIPKYPCTQVGCRRTGRNGFKRKDNLNQHLRTYHNMNLDLYETSRQADLTCPHPECPDFRGPDYTALSRRERGATRPFINKSNYTQHMKEVHDESPFPCPVPQCSKVGGKGYQREKDLIKHHKDRHPEAPPLNVSVRKVPKICIFPCLDAPVLEQVVTTTGAHLHLTSSANMVSD